MDDITSGQVYILEGIARYIAETEKLLAGHIQQRDQYLYLLSMKGFTTRELGQLVGISHSMVARIITREGRNRKQEHDKF